jgi:hypothetical protein
MFALLSEFISFFYFIFTGQNHSLCTAGVPNIALFCLLQGQLLQLRSVQMEEHLHPHSKFIYFLNI